MGVLYRSKYVHVRVCVCVHNIYCIASAPMVLLGSGNAEPYTGLGLTICICAHEHACLCKCMRVYACASDACACMCVWGGGGRWAISLSVVTPGQLFKGRGEGLSLSVPPHGAPLGSCSGGGGWAMSVPP